jgi:hypothetical protein
MKFGVRSQREFTAGLIFFCIGSVWLAGSLDHRIGTATAMGPGYFSMAVSLILAGSSSVVRSARSQTRMFLILVGCLRVCVGRRRRLLLLLDRLD